jgi:anti-sigma factor RsiW
MFGGGHVPTPWDTHPDEEALESHVMGKARGAKRARIEAHLLVCADCQERLAELDAFVGAVREAFGALGDSVGWTHATSDGPVQLQATRSRSRQWIARFQGRELEGGRTFTSLREAWDFLCRSFAEMYPEHRCTPRCRAERPLRGAAEA